jgi:hypothetical protein
VLYFNNGFWGQKLLNRERFVSWSIVMVENANFGPKFRPLSRNGFTLPLQYVHIMSLNACLALCKEFKVYSTLDIEESDEHCLHL